MPKAVSRRARILVAEDNPTNQLVVATMLERMGHYADVVGNGLEAVEALQRAPYDLVLMDVMMPEMDGNETTIAIRAIPGRKDLPILFLTAKAMAGDREKSFAAGASDYITKPVDPDKLISLVNGWLYV